MSQMTAGQAVIESLQAEGVKYVFGIIGVSFLDIADAFNDAPDIKFISTRHEQGAVCMASAYARISGKPGVCVATGGPGSVNLVGGIYNAYMAQVPVIAISGHAGMETQYREYGQELDNTAIFGSITKLAMTLPKVERIPELMRHCFRVAMGGKKGPVIIDFPTDMMRHGSLQATMQTPESYRPIQRQPGDPELIRQAAHAIKEAQRPLIIAGGGVTESNASGEVVALAESLSAPMVTSYRRNDAVPNGHSLYVGPFGTRAGPETAELVAQADVIIGVGTRLFGFQSLLENGGVAPDTKIIQIEIDEKELGRNCPVYAGIQGDAQAVVQGILEALRQEGFEGCDPAWTRQGEELRDRRQRRLDEESQISTPHISPRRVYAELRKALPSNTITILDAGACAAYGYDRTNYDEPRTFISPPVGGLGYAMPESIGAKLAKPDNPVLAIAGDGGFLFNSQELETAVREHIGTVTLVMNNNIWGSEKALQSNLFGRTIGSELTNPRFDKLAELYGGRGFYVDDINQLGDVLKEAFATKDRPSVIEIPVDPDDLSNLARR